MNISEEQFVEDAKRIDDQTTSAILESLESPPDTLREAIERIVGRCSFEIHMAARPSKDQLPEAEFNAYLIATADAAVEKICAAIDEAGCDCQAERVRLHVQEGITATLELSNRLLMDVYAHTVWPSHDRRH